MSMAWVALTDLSERPEIGKTTATCREIPDGVVFTGLLASLPANSGPVGFAIARKMGGPPFLMNDLLKFKARSSRNDIHFSVALEDAQMKTIWGELTFEKSFKPSQHKQEFQFLVSELKPKIRGKPAPAFTIIRNQIVSFSFQILRSRQDQALLAEAPLEFELTITW